MSKTENTASAAEQGEPENDSVFDFLYHDVRRVGSFLSQFDDAGLLQQVTQSEGAHRGSKRGWKASAGGSLPGIGSANVAVERGPEKGGFEASDRVYDPLWTNALTFLDFLTERDMLVRDISSARIGQFVLATGSLSILDLKLLHGLWELPAVRNAILRGMGENAPIQPNMESRAGRKQANVTRATGGPIVKSEAEESLEIGLSIIGKLPHVIQARITCLSGEVAWASLVDSGLVVSAADVVLKHGTFVAGEWAALGVLDAMPDTDASGNLTTAGTESFLQSIKLNDGPFGAIMTHLLPTMRPLLGRPFGAFGITPLLIFREIAS